MKRPDHIDISKYNYKLPEDRIAKYPLPERDQSLLLHYEMGEISHNGFNALPGILKEDDMLVFNNTRVIQARLEFKKETGARIELFCLEPVDPPEYQISFTQSEKCTWRCMIGNAKKWKQGDLSLTVQVNSTRINLNARVIIKEVDTSVVEFQWDNTGVTFAEILECAGNTPIPPYLKRSSGPDDKERYQTVYSEFNGSVAAPTAGLHFTDSVLGELQNKGIKKTNLTLHVGAGTFTPVKELDATRHSMHAETVLVERSTIQNLLDHTNRIIAVGTTSARSLESLYWLGVKAVKSNLDPSYILLSQWEIYELDNGISKIASLKNLLNFMEQNHLMQIQFQTRMMIVPGYRFKMVEGLVTNYHQPKSTLLLLIAALIGDRWQDVYDYALKNGFRFLSYGDSSLLFPSEDY